MKFELDTKAKTVKLLGDATLGEVNEVLEKVLGSESRKYRLITTVTNYNPVYVGRPYIVDPYVRWWEYPVYYGGTTATSTDANLTLAGGGTTTGIFVCETGAGGCLTVTNTSN